MTKNAAATNNFHFETPADPAREQPACPRGTANTDATDKKALELVRDALLQQPETAVLRPIAPIAGLVRAALAFVAAAEHDGGSGSAELLEVSVLAQALRAAQLRHLFKPLPAAADPGMAAHADMRMLHLEDAAAKLVSDGSFALSELPAAKSGSVRDRCARPLALVQFFRERGVKTRLNLAKTAKDAATLHHYGEETPAVIAITDLRDRAYTALTVALEAAMARAPKRSTEQGANEQAPISGVFAVDELIEGSAEAAA